MSGGVEEFIKFIKLKGRWVMGLMV